MKNFKRMIALLMAMLIFTAMAVTASAAGTIQLDHPSTLTAVMKNGSTAIPNAELSLYRVADISENAQFTLCGDFEDYDGSVNNLNGAENWDKLAAALVSYADNNSIGSICSGKTDSNGKLTFEPEDEPLLPGLYLLTCKKVTINKTEYTAKPCMVALPYRANDGEEWQYDVTVNPKTGKDTPEKPPYVPQTGMLWWPVPVLLAAGLLLVIIGTFRRRRENEA